MKTKDNTLTMSKPKTLTTVRFLDQKDWSDFITTVAIFNSNDIRGEKDKYHIRVNEDDLSVRIDCPAESVLYGNFCLRSILTEDQAWIESEEKQSQQLI